MEVVCRIHFDKQLEGRALPCKIKTAPVPWSGFFIVLLVNWFCKDAVQGSGEGTD